jgi:hypothetical protein
MTQNDDVVTLHGSVALQAVSEGIERWIINRIRRIIFISVFVYIVCFGGDSTGTFSLLSRCECYWWRPHE